MRQRTDARAHRAAGRVALWLALALAMLALLPPAVAAAEPGTAARAAVGAGGDGAGVVAAAPRPGDECDDATEAEAGALCNDGGGGGGGGSPDLAMILAVLGGALVVGVLLLIGAFLYLRRQAGAPLLATEPGSEWWTCNKCGKSNMAGTPRCYACGAWEG